MPRSRHVSRRSWALPAVLLAYACVVRTWDVTEQLWLLGDQIRDWSIAMRDLGDVPLVGPSSVAGGHVIGPGFYWFLWLSRVTLGATLDELPHAGAIAMAVVHAGADVLLFIALARRFGSWVPAMAIALLLVSAPYDLSLAMAMWAPSWGVICTKVAIAMVLGWGASTQASAWRMAGAVGAAWLALHGHLGPVFVVIPVLTWPILRGLGERALRPALIGAAAVVVPIALLQIPFAIHLVTRPDVETRPTRVIESLAMVVRGEAPLRLAESFRALATNVDFLLLDPPLAGAGLIVLPIAVLAAVARARRDPELLLVSVTPLVLAWLGFAAWQDAPWQEYWYLSLMPSAAITLVMAATALPARRVAQLAALASLAVVVAAQPARLARAATMHHLEAYGPLVRASRQMVKYGRPLRAIEADFLPPSTDPRFIYVVLGGRISPEAELVATISASGATTYRRVRR